MSNREAADTAPGGVYLDDLDRGQVDPDLYFPKHHADRYRTGERTKVLLQHVKFADETSKFSHPHLERLRVNYRSNAPYKRLILIRYEMIHQGILITLITLRLFVHCSHHWYVPENEKTATTRSSGLVFTNSVCPPRIRHSY